jgi:hypothetical protein
MANQEKSERFNKPGIYKDPESGVELEAKHHPKYGSAQADAFVRLGWRWTGEAKTASQKVAEKITK